MLYLKGQMKKIKDTDLGLDLNQEVNLRDIFLQLLTVFVLVIFPPSLLRVFLFIKR